MPTVLEVALLEIRNELDTGDVHARSALRRLVEGLEAKRERARLWCVHLPALAGRRAIFSTPGGIRTPDPLLRRQLLSPN